MRHKRLTHIWRAATRKAHFRRLLTLSAGACLAMLVFVILVSDSRPVLAQNRMNFSMVSANSGHIALGLALRKLSVSGTFMQAPAHPDDETNALFALFGYGMGLRVIDVQNNRGDGGQNEIGPELFRDIAVLRTSELLAAHRIDGAEQYFTRAIDYGYSFDPQEVIDKWGRKEIVGDYVRLIRTLRPDVMVTMNIQGRGGDRAHEATTVLVREAFRAAGDPSMYPEQIARKACGRGSRRSCTSRGGHRQAVRAAAGGADAAGGGSRRGRREAHAGQHGRRTTRCSAAPTPRSAPTRAAITSARAWAGSAAAGARRAAEVAAGRRALQAVAATQRGRRGTDAVAAAAGGRGGGPAAGAVTRSSRPSSPARCRNKKPRSSTASTPA